MLTADIVVLAALSTERDLERFPDRAAYAFALAIEHHGIDAIPVNEEGAFERAEKRVVAPR